MFDCFICIIFFTSIIQRKGRKRKKESMKKVISDIQVAFIKTAIIIIIAAAVATIVSVFIYPSLALSLPSYIGVLEGMTPATTDDKSKDSKAAVSAAIPKEDDDLKCPGAKRKDVKCEVADIIRLGYELASDPIMSQTEQDKFHAVFESRSKDTADKNSGKLAGLINRFMGDVMMLRFTVMFNTKPNEAELKKTLDKMIKEKDPKSCYSLDDMKQVKGLLVGTAEQKTLTVAQSEAIRCYMQRFNSVRACMGICDDKKV
jgi:hypothetical protein